MFYSRCHYDYVCVRDCVCVCVCCDERLCRRSEYHNSWLGLLAAQRLHCSIGRRKGCKARQITSFSDTLTIMNYEIVKSPVVLLYVFIFPLSCARVFFFSFFHAYVVACSETRKWCFLIGIKMPVSFFFYFLIKLRNQRKKKESAFGSNARFQYTIQFLGRIAISACRCVCKDQVCFFLFFLSLNIFFFFFYLVFYVR